jgi:hypothetical protein
LPGGDNKQKAFNYFVDKGLTDVQAAAIVGNFIVESSLNTSADQPGGPGMGIAQWSNPGRWDNLQKYAAAQGKDKFDFGLQLDFVWLELQGTPPGSDYSAVLKKLKTLSDITDATGFFMGTAAVNDSDPAADAFMAKYGRVAGYENPGTPHLDLRIKAAKGVLGQFGGSGSGAVSGSDSSCSSVGSVNCSAASQDSAAGQGNSSSSGLSQVRQNVVCIAKAELAKWKSGEMGPGGSNIKYIQSHVEEEWCADFMSWVYKQAGYPVTGSMSNWQQAGALEMENMPPVDGSKFELHHPGSYIPVPGDMVTYSFSHVNMVVSVNKNAGTMTVIGGNQGGIHANDQSLVSEYTINGFTGNDIHGYVSPKE